MRETTASILLVKTKKYDGISPLMKTGQREKESESE